jgi:hypothetical protein
MFIGMAMRDGQHSQPECPPTALGLGSLPLTPDDAAAGASEQLVATTREDSRWAWLRDRTRIAFNSDRAGPMHLWLYTLADRTTRQITSGAGPSADVVAGWDVAGVLPVMRGEDVHGHLAIRFGVWHPRTSDTRTVAVPESVLLAGRARVCVAVGSSCPRSPRNVADDRCHTRPSATHHRFAKVRHPLRCRPSRGLLVSPQDS